MAAELVNASEQAIEYVEFLDVQAYAEDVAQPEIITIDDDGDEEVSEIIAIDDENCVANGAVGDEIIEYIEAEEIAVAADDVQVAAQDSQHTIIVHEGKQYVIPTEQLNRAGHTILLDDDEYEVNAAADDDGSVYFTEADGSDAQPFSENDEMAAALCRQYAVLQDGKLHIRDIDGGTGGLESTDDMHQKLRALQNTLSCYKEEEDDEEEEAEADEKLQLENQHPDDNGDNNSGIGDGDDDDNDIDTKEELPEITGRNLITGQTITLSGFLEKMRQRTNPTAPTQRRSGDGRTRRSSPQPPPDYVLVPPVNRRVIVGRTQDGRRLVGRILQIQKKIGTAEAAAAARMAAARTRQRHASNQPRRRPAASQPQVPARPPPPPVVIPSEMRRTPDENVSRTLAGLMDLESVERKLAGRRVVVRHVQRRSFGGRTLPGSRRVAYYSGRMQRAGAGSWRFDADPAARAPGDIDLRDSGDNQQVELHVDDIVGGVAFNSLHESRSRSDGHRSGDGRGSGGGGSNNSNYVDRGEDDDDDDDVLNSEPVMLNLTVTQDEFGKKRTKVTIPQLGGVTAAAAPTAATAAGELHVCDVCGKRFQAAGSLRRHQAVHDPSLRPLQCLSCMARFTDESSLRKHMVLHTGVRPFRCDTCGKCFAHRGDLNFHARSHDPLKRYSCDMCGKLFNRYNNMLRHAEIHRPPAPSDGGVADAPASETGESGEASGSGGDEEVRPAPFTCETCGCQYKFISSLTRHIVNNHMGAALGAAPAPGALAADGSTSNSIIYSGSNALTDATMDAA